LLRELPRRSNIGENMRRINGVSVLVAVVVITYLITRPHVGTVWHVVWENPIYSPINSPPPGFGTPEPPLPRGSTPITPPSKGFVDERECVAAAMRFENASDVTGTHCESGNALLWGW
jgi:hypothetical protein